ncbi:DUF6584 family protein [Kitasatospora sp. NPDC048715]|uniref:DUF6584 family protein n=1 Tax=Kitasatospora sp. NPDC048715 TaxID=3364052 RepID=UPI0037248A91
MPVTRLRQRGLAASYPAELTVRRRLAEVYHLYGEPAEAGRWAHLDADRSRPHRAGAPGLRGARRRHLRPLVALTPVLRCPGAPALRPSGTAALRCPRPFAQSRCSAASQSRHRCCSSSGGYHGSPGRAGR